MVEVLAGKPRVFGLDTLHEVVEVVLVLEGEVSVQYLNVLLQNILALALELGLLDLDVLVDFAERSYFSPRLRVYFGEEVFFDFCTLSSYVLYDLLEILLHCPLQVLNFSTEMSLHLVSLLF